VSGRGRYGNVEANARRLSPEGRRVRVLAILDVLASTPDEWGRWFPNAIGEAVKLQGVELSQPHGHSGKRLGAGSAIAPTLTALQRRGWITSVQRSDGLSGGAYEITREGRAALAAWRERGEWSW
jgi:hypothetical protein